MVVLRNVAIAGASGNLGPAIVNAILDSGKFNVTILTRERSTSEYRASVKVVTVDYSSISSLTAALQGQDALISTIATAVVGTQRTIVDAVIAAGIKRFLPSEFGSDLQNPKTRTLPVFKQKVAMEEYLKEKASLNPDFSYTLVSNGAFLDWGLNFGFLFSWKEGKPAIFDGGDQLITTTTLPVVGKAVVGVLTHPDETANRVVYVQEMAISQNKILAIAKRLTPEKKWEPVQADLRTMVKAADESLAKGIMSDDAIFAYLFQSLMGKGFGRHFQKLDNELLGIEESGEAMIEELLKPLLAEYHS